MINESSETLSFRRLFNNSKAVFAYIFTQWKLITVVVVVGSLLGVSYAYYSKPSYTAELNYVLSDGNSQNTFSSLANQFGFNIGNVGTDVFSQDNALFLMTSRKMLMRALFKTIPNSRQSLINLYISSEDIDKKWKKQERLNSAFPFPENYHSMTPVQDSLFREIYTSIKNKYFKVQQQDKQMNVFKVSTTYHNEVFACFLTKYLVEEAASFYIETKTSIARQNLNMLNREADSLRRRLGTNIVNTATAVDRTFNLNPALQLERAPVQKSQADAMVTQAAYTEVVKNLEVAKITLARAFPIYQVIDEPSLPLKNEKMGRLKGAIIFGAIAGLLTVIFFALKFFVTKISDGVNYEKSNNSI